MIPPHKTAEAVSQLLDVSEQPHEDIPDAELPIPPAIRASWLLFSPTPRRRKKRSGSTNKYSATVIRTRRTKLSQAYALYASFRPAQSDLLSALELTNDVIRLTQGRDPVSLVLRALLSSKLPQHTEILKQFTDTSAAIRILRSGLQLRNESEVRSQPQHWVDLLVVALFTRSGTATRRGSIEKGSKVRGECIDDLQEVLRLRPQHNGALYAMGCLLCGGMSEIDDVAIEFYTRAIRVLPKPIYIVARGTELNRLKRYEEALLDFQALLQMGVVLVEAVQGCGDALMHLYRYKQAIGMYDRCFAAPGLDPKRRLDVLINKGICCSYSFQFAEAVKCLTEALSQRDAQPTRNQKIVILMALAISHDSLGHTSERDAVRARLAELNLTPEEHKNCQVTFIAPDLTRAGDLLRDGEYDQALVLAKKVIGICPNNILSRNILIECYLNLDRLEEGLRECNESIRVFEEEPESLELKDFGPRATIGYQLVLKGEIYLAMEDSLHALLSFSEATQVTPSLLTYTRLARHENDIGELTDALCSVNLGLKIDKPQDPFLLSLYVPYHHEALLVRGFIWLQLGCFDNALDDFTVVTNPETSKAAYAHRCAGLAHYALQNYDLAVSDFQKALSDESIASDMHDALYFLSVSLKHLGRHVEAAEALLTVKSNFASCGTCFSPSKACLADYHKSKLRAVVFQARKNVCSVCGLVEGDEVMRLCGGCKSVRYCSRDCQVKDWKKRHRAACKKRSNRRALRRTKRNQQ